VTNAHGGLVVEINCLKLGLVEERGYEVARAGHVKVVHCKRVRKDEKKQRVPKHQSPLQNTSQPQKNTLVGRQLRNDEEHAQINKKQNQS